MPDRQPIDDFDIKGLFAAIDGKLAAGGKIGDLFLPAVNSKDISSVEAENLYQQRLKLLNGTFRDNILRMFGTLTVQQAGVSVKENFEDWRSSRLINPSIRDEDKEFARYTTLQILAETAEREHERLARLLGASVPGSPEAQRLNVDALKWGKISTIVREASEIKE